MISTSDNPIIVALDNDDAASALALADQLLPEFSYFKVGSRLFVSEGRALVDQLLERAVRVFIDLKFHDIPDQVAGAARSVTAAGASMFTVHSLGGGDMISAAVTASRSEAEARGTRAPVVLGVTILTSHGGELEEIGIDADTGSEVLRLARLALAAGADGVVASPLEAGMLRSALGNDFVIVTPGIRSVGEPLSDQTRTAGPAEAVRSGADYLVVGRPITKADSPKATAEAMLKEVLDERRR